jgi:hypothetical protein
LSSTLADSGLVQLGQEDVDAWINYWREIGFLKKVRNI